MLKAVSNGKETMRIKWKKYEGGKIFVKKNKKGKYFFAVVARNGRILCHSESYSSRSKAVDGAVAVRRISLDADILTETGEVLG